MKYLDTSILYDFYVRGPHTQKVRTFCNKNQQNLAISTWTETEFYGVLGRRSRGGAIPQSSAVILAKKFKSHLASGLYQLLTTDAPHISGAALLTRRFSLAIKSPDAVHLALVQQEACELVTSDKAMAVAAKSLSLAVTLIEV